MQVIICSVDLRGSVRVGWDPRGAALVWFGYGPFGTPIGTAASACGERIERRYAGQRHERESGLYDFGARLYDAHTCRFVSVDPRHQTPSPYAYCADDPVDHVDRDGRGFEKVIYFPATATSGAFFRGYKYKTGEYVGFDLPEEPPEIFLSQSAAGPRLRPRPGSLLRTIDEFYVYAEHSGMRTAVPIKKALVEVHEHKTPEGRRKVWTTVVSYLKRDAVDYRDLSPALQQRVCAIDDRPFLKAPEGRLFHMVKLMHRKGEPITSAEIDQDLARLDSDDSIAERPAKRRKVAHDTTTTTTTTTAVDQSPLREDQLERPVESMDVLEALGIVEKAIHSDFGGDPEALAALDELTEIHGDAAWEEARAHAPSAMQPAPASASNTTAITRKRTRVIHDDD